MDTVKPAFTTTDTTTTRLRAATRPAAKGQVSLGASSSLPWNITSRTPRLAGLTWTVTSSRFSISLTTTTVRQCPERTLTHCAKSWESLTTNSPMEVAQQTQLHHSTGNIMLFGICFIVLLFFIILLEQYCTKRWVIYFWVCIQFINLPGSVFLSA